jgi:hypothetical protein
MGSFTVDYTTLYHCGKGTSMEGSPRLNMCYRVVCIGGIGVLFVVFLGGINEIYKFFI